jgi:transposase
MKSSKWLPDNLWARIEPLLPAPKRRRRKFPGRKPLGNREVLTGIIFVLRTGIPWREMPAELGYGSGMTCLRRLKQWHRRGVFQKLYEILLEELNGADKIDWSRALVDSATTKAPGGGEKTGPNPTDRRKLESSCAGRCARDSASGEANRSECPRRHPSHSSRRRGPSGSGKKKEGLEENPLAFKVTVDTTLNFIASN